MSCSCHISPPCTWCENSQECDQCNNIYHKSETEWYQAGTEGDIICQDCFDRKNKEVVK